MRFKPGDTVIKITGGNKMKIVECTNIGIRCAWVSESYNEETFHEEELVPISEYKCLLNNYKRNDIIEQILK
jgi:uncharacterized protein YodC (DUF2158 family)